MSTDTQPVDDQPVKDAVVTPTPPSETIEVRRDGVVLGLVTLLAGVVALAFLRRAAGGDGSPLDWLMFVLTGGIAVAHLAAVLDARLPLLVIDRHGVRVRRGSEWQGVAWPEVARVEHLPRTSLLRDGRLVVHQVDQERVLDVRLSLATRLVGANWHELTEALDEMTGGRTDVVEETPDAAEITEETGETGETHDRDDEVFDQAALDDEPTGTIERVEPTDEASDEASDKAADEAADEAPVEPEREPTLARRSDAVLATAPRVAPAVPPEADETQVTGLIHVGDATDATEVTGLPVREPVRDLVVGPQLTRARERLGLSVAQLADRTRIRPHVIEAIEVDDFTPCGGDFYARGHLRTLARVLGLEATPLLDAYDAEYADAPIDARRVFEAELATAADGPIRSTKGGMNWSVLVAAVMALVLAWSVARLVLDHPAPVSNRVILNGSPGGKASLTSKTTDVPVTLVAATGGAKVIVRDGAGKVVFDDQIPFMGTVDVQASPPVRISSSDGGLQVTLDGTDKGAIGSTGHRAEQTYVP